MCLNNITFLLPTNFSINWEIDKEEIVDIDTWNEFKKVRNSISHDYPDEVEEKVEAINYLIENTPKLIEVIKKLKIRLSEKEIKTIKDLATKIFGNCEVYIFGSQTNLTKKGGDIDIFIIPQNKEDLFKKKIKLSAKLESVLGKPVDVVVSGSKNTPIEEEALKGVKI